MSLSLYFSHSGWGAKSGAFASDIRREAGGGWSFDVAKSFSDAPEGDEVLLRFEGTAQLPGRIRLWLLDHDSGATVDLLAHPIHSDRAPGPGSATIGAGFESTVLPFQLSHPSNVRMDIYNVSGAVAARFTLGYLEAGPHRFTWYGDDGLGNRLPSGVYWAQLCLEGERHARRVVLAR